MTKIPIPPPQLPPIPSEEEIENLKTYKMSDEKKAYINEKYIKPAQKRELNLKKKKRSDWWKNNAVNVATLLVAILTLISTIVLGILALLR